jgi:hypothetical protein
MAQLHPILATALAALRWLWPLGLTAWCWAGPPAETLWAETPLVHVTHLIRNHTVVAGSTKIFSPGKVHDFLRSAHQRRRQPHTNAQRLDLEAAGVIPAGTLPIHLEPMANGDLKLTDIHNLMTQQRITSHWSVAEPVQDFPPETESKRVIVDWSEARIGIIEPAKAFRGQLWGGHAQDMIVVGPHPLSGDAYLLVPKDLAAQVKAENPDYPGHYWIYSETEFRNAREAILDFNRIYGSQHPGAAKLRQPRLSAAMPPEAQRDAVLEFLDLRQGHAPAEYERYRLWCSEHCDAILRGEESKACGAFLAIARGTPEVSYLVVDGLAQFGMDYFSSWIQEEPFQWAHHDATPFRRLEQKLHALFFAQDIRNVASLLTPVASPGQPRNPHVTADSAQEVRALLKEVQAATRHLAPATRAFVAQHARNLELRLALQLALNEAK